MTPVAPSALFFFMMPSPHRSTLFPYTTLFRSLVVPRHDERFACSVDDDHVHGGMRPAGITRVLEHHRSEEHTSELQSRENLVCRLLLEKKNDCHSRRLADLHTPLYYLRQ